MYTKITSICILILVLAGIGLSEAQVVQRKPIETPELLNEQDKVTYEILKSSSNQQIDEKILKGIAQRRLEDKDVVWKVKDLEILIYSRKNISKQKQGKKFKYSN